MPARSIEQERSVLVNLINHLNPQVVRDGVCSFADKSLLGDDEHTIFVVSLGSLSRRASP
jgi:hypothetical protein